MIAQAGDDDDESRDEAWRHLIERYRRPVGVTLRRLIGRGDPDELADEFFSYLYAHEVLRKPQREKGKFRQYMQATLRRYASSQRRGRAEDRRKVSSEPEQFDARIEEAPDVEMEREEQRVWAMAYLANALERLKKRSAYYHELVVRGFGLDGDPPLDRAELAERVERDRGAVNTAMHRIYAILEGELKQEIRDTVSDPEALEDEWLMVRRYLLDAFPGLRDLS